MPTRTVPEPGLVYDRRVSTGPASFERIFVLVPVRGLEDAKARLGEALDAEERRTLVERLLARTVAAATATRGVAAVAVVSPDREVLDLGVRLGAVAVSQRGGGLNEGLGEGRAWAEEAGADALLVIPVDLPAVTPGEIEGVVAGARALAGAGTTGGRGPRPLVAIVPDRAGSGTNALLVAPPGAIPFSFGIGSRAAHAASARAAGADYLEIGGPLTLDLDTPDDLLAAEAAGLAGLRAELP
jgi:2-phospho-L-lactate guanylyltransferase